MAELVAGLTREQVNRLRESFGGEVIAPGDDGYDDARRVWNAMFDRRPAMFVRPTRPATSRPRSASGATTASRSPSAAAATATRGTRPPDGGLVIDLSRLRGVTVDPERRNARGDGGALLGELDVAAQAHGLVCPVGVIGHTGVGGLTLGGGMGRLQRNFGLTIDNLRAVELVTADGRMVRASESRSPSSSGGSAARARTSAS